MSRPSRGTTVGAIAFLTIFGLPFLGMGLLFAYTQLLNAKHLPPLQVAAGAGFGLVFAFIGAGLIYAGFFGYRVAKQQAELQEANPNSPWMWRKDWALGRAESLNKKSWITYWVVAVLCNLVSFPFALMALPSFARNHNPVVFFSLIFNVIGMIFVVVAVRATLRHTEYGNGYFEFEGTHFTPGERAAGNIQLKFEKRADHGVILRLACVRKVSSGTGDNRTTSQITLWQSDRNVFAGAIAPGPLGRSIPVEFIPPAECPNTNHENTNDQIVWMLHAEADVPGVDYMDDFELPFFGRAVTANSFSNQEEALGANSSSRFGFATARLVDSDTGPVPRPSNAKAKVTSGADGTTFYFRPFRDPVRALMLDGATAFWTLVVYGLYHKGSPVFIFVVFGLVDLFLIAGSLYVTLGSGCVTVRNGEISWRRGILGLGGTHLARVSEIASIVAIMSPQQGPNPNTQQHTIRMRMKDGKKFTLADQISSRQEARWLVSEIEKLAGMQIDTHVETDLPLGVSPMPGGPSTNAVFSRRGTNTSTGASVGIFIAIVAGMIGFMLWRMTSISARRNGARAMAASSAKPIQPRVFSGPLTDADVQRLNALPIQTRAEELLERAISRDDQARILFDEQIGSWTGRIQMSDRMRQLEQRSRYSKDLRIRYANEDLNLAIEGWKKNEQSADALIARASADKDYRPTALFYLGVLAGRGVDYERIHGVLTEYARKDPDAAVRQWAVEGMRFLGKDEALDDLFISFTRDPSTNVRNRAGCNISDCGTFTRKQRMRMVPKLIDLVTNPSTSGQMRGWTFLALQEITDEHLPADANVWSRWYQEHGAEKMAEFERLDWWQIRGDE
jgi:hypothetical protein